MRHHLQTNTDRKVERKERNDHKSDRLLSTFNKFRSPSGFEPPGLNPLADMDPWESIFASGFRAPLREFGPPPKKVIILYFRTPGVVNE